MAVITNVSKALTSNELKEFLRFLICKSQKAKNKKRLKVLYARSLCVRVCFCVWVCVCVWVWVWVFIAV